jgi:hypothetical protein
MLRISWMAYAVVSCLVLAGCGRLGRTSPSVSDAGTAAGNPLFVAVADREIVWNQVIDEVDNYFQIEREERVRFAGNVLTEGTITTYPRIGSSILEPWHRDSAAGYEKLLSTLQTIRRRAVVRVIPTNGGYLVDVAVFKELEDRIESEGGGAGPVTLRYDDSLVRPDAKGERNEDAFEDLPPGTLGWIPLGRDPLLEQRILNNIAGRLHGL